MNNNQLIALISVGQLAVDLFKAERVAKTMYSAYTDKIHEYEEVWGDIKGKLDPFADEHAHVRQFTQDAFDAYKLAKRKAYNVKRRLENACRKVAA